MLLETIRPYEMSLWTLQDSFITVLRPIEGLFPGQIITPEISLKNDNTQILTFSIPMYYRDRTGMLIENPLWYSTKDGSMLVNLRKIKVIFNKGEKGEGVFEFVIQKITESHSSGQLICDVEAEGLAFQELGKSGYKITLNYDEFLIDLEKEEKKGNELIANLNYWAEKLFDGSSWTYSIQMDWSSYDGIIDVKEMDNEKIVEIDYEELSKTKKDELNKSREENGLRRRDKVYEEEYISSWEKDEDSQKIVPRELVSFKEKARIPQIQKSNRYNASQDLAELFEVYCKYKYIYDSNYAIVGRECIFYNNFLDENTGKFDINYPDNTNSIKRILESADVVTKMYVVPTEDISIVDVSANELREDYILNFDYLYEIGTITQEQYDEIETYQYNIHSLNSEYEIFASKKNKFDIEINELKAEHISILNSISYSNEQINEAERSIASISGEKGYLEKTIYNPEQIILTEEGSGENKTYKTSFNLENIDEESIVIYLKYSGGQASQKLSLEGAIPVYETGNIVGYTNLKIEKDDKDKSNFAFLVCNYNPTLKYETIISEYERKLANDERRKTEIQNRMKEIGFSYEDGEFELEEDFKSKQPLNYYTITKNLNEIQEELQDARNNFERMMGPALREGSWQPEKDYSDDGDRFTEILTFGSTNNTGKFTKTIWDEELFDEEEVNYYEEGINFDKVFYPMIDLREIYPILYNAVNSEDSLIKEEDFVLHFKISKGEDEYFNYYFNIFSSFDYAFVKKDGVILPVFVIKEEFTEEELSALQSDAKIGTQTVEANGSITFTPITGKLEIIFAQNENEYKTIYPRIKFETDKLKTTDDELSIYLEKNKLEKYTEYTLLNRDENHYLTIKPKTFIAASLVEVQEDNKVVKKLDLTSASFILHYALSNAALMMYLDALKVSKTNAYPQASYEVSVSSLNRDFIKYLYKKLNKIANINDYELKFENVQGYISELKISLDKPDQDSITIQNYKTKFEDLFSRIVASTEQMKSNQFAYDRAASSFTSSGYLSQDVIQQSISQGDLKYSFNNGKLSIDEKNGIWSISEDGAVAMRGGGIFCATEKDVNNNWLWHTGITPSGINASLLRAGTIDTNLIRIYSGNNVRFQMNGDGLFAYAKDNDGKTNFNKFVVHNEDGLFLTENITNLVEISWDGLILRDKNGEPVFYADRQTGNLSITGEIKANTGKIGGWSIDENGLKADNKDAFIYATRPTEVSTPIYEMLRISGEGEDGGTFVVKSDGTLYATNAFFHGSVAAGSFIANMKTEDAVDAIKRLELVNFYGTSFNYTNPNLDGDIILERDSLNFVCRQIGITCHTWKISKVIQLEDKDNGIPEELDLCWSYSKKDKEKTEEKTEESYKGLMEASIINDLTFSLNCGIIEPNKETEDEESAIFKIVGIATEFGYDDQGKVDANKTVEEEYEYYFTIYNSKKNITKRISLFDPPSYSFKNPTLYEQSLEDLRIDKINTLDIGGGSLEEKFGSEYFIGNNFKDDDDVLSNFSDFLTSMELSAELLSQVTSNAEDLVNNNFELANEIIKYLNDSIALKNSKDFVLTLTNIDLRESNVLAESRARTGEAVLDGNSDSSVAVFSDSTILVNDDFLKDGVLEINGRPIEEGNPVTGNEYNIEVFYEPAKEGSNESKLIFRVYRNDVPEGEELYLRYSYEKAFRTCNVFRPKNGANSINTVIKSSEGNMFKNGNVDTELSVEVYDGATLLNGPGTKYGYIWFQDGKAVERMLNQKEGIKITAEDFGSKANYTVHVYSSREEAEQAYYGMELANKI